MASDSPDSVSRRRFLQATGAAGAAATLAGCSPQQGTPGGNGTQSDTDTPKSSPPQTDTPEPVEGGTLRRTLTGTITTFDPIAATDTASGIVIQQVFDALMNYPDGEQAATTQLATDYSVSEDFTTYTFTLKEGVTFHDGTELTAEDFVYSWERLVRSPHSARAYFALSSMGISYEKTEDGTYKPGSLAVSAEGEYTLKIELDGPFAFTLPMLAYTAFAPLPKDYLGDISSETNDEGEPSEQYREFAQSDPVGTGPFQNVTWKQGESAEVEAYGDYHGTGPYLDGVHLRVLEDPNAQFQYVQNNRADLFTVPTSKFDPAKVSVEYTDDLERQHGTYGPMQNGQTVNYAKVPELSLYYFAFNAANIPRPVRRAAAYVINQHQLSQQVFKGRYQPGYHITPPAIYPGGVPAYEEHAKNEYPYGYDSVEIDEAKSLMEEAGYGPDNKFEMTLTHYTSDVWSQASQIVRDRLSAAHINLSIEQAEFSTMLQRGKNGELEMYTLGWVADYPGAGNFLQLVYPPRTDTSDPGPSTYTDWDDVDSQAKRNATQAFEKILENRAPTDEDQQARNEAYVTMEEANWEDVILVPTFHANSQPMWYNGTHVPVHGSMGPSRQSYNTAWKEESAQE
ncbi:ABC transporter substrate-binding protein [Halorarius halobius]|uniref:ABC transporter substrate-binding protein n=1 Tax=Halorarius halobius TaxID=2962671 RepID=UPI0020CE9766|nr:ABC transporter substrate-binding protein [Halorarius halobius]